MTDAAGRIVTREHPEHMLLAKLERCESLQDILQFCIWVLSEIGYKELARAIERRLEEAIEEADEKAANAANPIMFREEDHESL